MAIKTIEAKLHNLDPFIWDSIKKVCNYPNLKDPVILEDVDQAQQIMGDSIAYIRMDTHDIFVNLPRLRERVGEEHLDIILWHEMLHYKLIPYDLNTALFLMNDTLKVVKDEDKAAYIQNLFADILVNTKIHQDDTKVVDTYREMNRRGPQEKNNVWDLYMRIYERLWDLPEGTYVNDCDPEVEKDAKKLEKLLSDQMFRASTWRKKIHTFATVFKKHMEKVHPSNACNYKGGSGKGDQSQGGGSNGQQQQNQGGSGNQQQQGGDQGQQPQQGDPGQGDKQKQGGGPGQNKQQGGDDGKQKQKGAGAQQGKDDSSSPTPGGILIDKHEPGDFGDVEKGLKDIAGELDRDDFKRLAAGVGGAGNAQKANKMYYQALADAYSLEMPEEMEKGTSYYRTRDKIWEPSRGISRLDIKRTIMKSGRPIPSYNTLEGISEGSSQLFGSGKRKDLLIIIDTSVSMANPRNTLSYATLSSMVAAHSAHNQGSKVAVINFASYIKVTKYTRDINKIDDALMNYQAGGTCLPTHELVDLIKSNENPQHILLITDAETANIDHARKYFKQAYDITKSGTIFLVDPNGKDAQILEDIGYRIQPMTGEDDMLDATLDDMQEVYG
ncbi:VWA domain-containing protein [Candidatus Woesearchaeota archaeon]|nr:VWA domain-containing protein [Candidatus Woesearchaeota archaeon]